MMFVQTTEKCNKKIKELSENFYFLFIYGESVASTKNTSEMIFY